LVYQTLLTIDGILIRLRKESQDGIVFLEIPSWKDKQRG
jgi:hypothetical protein